MRHTSSHTKNRRSHHALTATNLVKDAESGTLRKPHRLDEATGMYRGKQIVPQAELDRRAKRAEAANKRVEETPAAEGMPTLPHAHAENEPAAPAAKPKESLLGRMTKNRTKTRSGLGGGGS